MLLERDRELDALQGAARGAAESRGCTVLVTGEAGIGKTTLVDRFAADAGARARVLRGACEALFTPRPLGPVHDVLHSLGGPLLAKARGGGSATDLFLGLLEDVRRHAGATVLVIEDVHWADEATLDFIGFAARRLAALPLALVLTYRNDEVDAEHPLVRVLGEIPASGVLRIALARLSVQAVEQLARAAGASGAGLHPVTRGNPFFVTELLRAGDARPIVSIQDAVMARVHRLSETARHVLELVAVVPDHIELGVLEALVQPLDASLEECVRRGLLELAPGRVGFRHELARMAVHDSLSPVRRMRLNRSLIEPLAALPRDAGVTTRLAHHAIAAMDPPAILAYVREAARIATERRAHREAAALLTAALPHVDGLPPEERAAFYEQRARALYVSALGPEVIEMSEAAHRIRVASGDLLAMARNAIEFTDFALGVRTVSIDDGIARGRAAIAALESRPPDALLARAYLGVLMLLGVDDPAESARLRERVAAIPIEAVAPAERPDLLIRVATAEWMSLGYPRVESIEAAMAAARACGTDRDVTRVHMLHCWRWSRTRQLDRLVRTADEGVAFALARGLERYIFTYALERFAAEAALARCDWDGARRGFESVAATADAPWFMRRVHARLPAALVAARTGAACDAAWLADELTADPRLASNDRFALHRLRAEIFWLCGDDANAVASARAAVDVAERWGSPWLIGEAAFWRECAGGEPVPVDRVAEPFGQRGREAAGTWTRLGYRYEAALALASGDVDMQREAVRDLDAIGAHGAAAAVRERLMRAGARGLSRGPRPSTRSNAAGLTAREQQILALLAEGLSNADMALRLHRSVRTVEHHVGVLLEKLGAGSRQSAVVAARRRGLLRDSAQDP